MQIRWHPQVQKRLKQSVNMCCHGQVLTTGHQGHSLQGVVHGDTEVVAGGRVLACQNDIAEQSRLGPLRPSQQILPTQWARHLHRLGDIEPKRVGQSLLHLPAPITGGQRSARSRIDRTVGSMRSILDASHLIADLPPKAAA